MQEDFTGFFLVLEIVVNSLLRILTVGNEGDIELNALRLLLPI